MNEPANPASQSPPSLLSPPAQAGPGEFLHPIARAFFYLVIAFFMWTELPQFVFTVFLGLPRPARYVFLYVLLNAGLLAEAWLFLRALDRRSFRTLGLWFYPRGGRELAYGAAGGALLMAVIVIVLFASRAVQYAGLAGAPGELLPRLAVPGAIFFLAAVFEEIAFRGYAFQRLLDAAGPIVAVTSISGLFGALHITNPYATPLSTLNTVLAGVLFSLAYLKTRALWFPIGLHWAWNFFEGSLFSFPVSGLRLGATLLRAEYSGANWLTGGAYGPEGGLAVTLVSLAAILCLARSRRVAPSPAMLEVLE